MYVCLFLAGVTCSILMSEANSKTDTYKAGDMALDVEKSEAFENGSDNELGRLRYTVNSRDYGFEIEFFTDRSRLSPKMLKDGKVRVRYNPNKKSTLNTYLDISVRGRHIKRFEMDEYFKIGSEHGATTIMKIEVESVYGGTGSRRGPRP